ncbi:MULTISPECIES: MFS transporter [unclassified Mesorhizobium]|uniref:MFS transporter n=1 Tax=unclassified Mesorhizobium TaxID=325217 RepID=UPI0011297B2E|nr:MULTISPECIES: MFS transporter [unclassified Mesorhizobium]MBZ9811030.1 MFS transporter [Mesorhizobium sp. ESP-6-2]TPM27803.1 MFS transporter [Mesorhizobium sp. B2-2-2]
MSLRNDVANQETGRDESAAGAARPPTLLFAFAVGVIVTNLFAPQTLVGLIGPSLGLGTKGSSLASTAPLLGYATGLFLLVPLADVLENRALVTRMLACAALAAGGAFVAPTATSFLVFLFLLGAFCSAIQVLVPIAASMADPEGRGRVIGDVMSGLMVGILLARPSASFIASSLGWRAFYAMSSIAMMALTGVLFIRLPRRQPDTRSRYLTLIASLGRLLASESILRRRALTASLTMAAFSLFWTAIALRLAEAPFDLGQRGIALFALVGAGGAIATPLFGRMGDRGWERPTTITAHIVLIGALGLAIWAGSVHSNSSLLPLVMMGASAVLLDIGVTGDQTLGRRAINLLQAEARGRLNALFVGLFFIGGAMGSALAGVAWGVGGWNAVCAIGISLSVLSVASQIVRFGST